MPRSNGPTILATLAILFVFVMVTPAAAQGETGRCVSAETPSDVLLPDGSLHPAGRIEICMAQKYTPVSGLHITRLADGFSGMFLSRRSRSEGVVENGQPYIQFLRARGGELILDAYAVPDGQKRLWLYRIKPIGKKVVKRPELALALETRDHDRRIVQIAAAAY